MNLPRIHRRRKFVFDVAEHRAALAEIDGRLRAARALYAEIKGWPSPLACWLMLQAGQGQPIWNPVGQPRELRLDLRARGLPLPLTTRSIRRFR